MLSDSSEYLIYWKIYSINHRRAIIIIFWLHHISWRVQRFHNMRIKGEFEFIHSAFNNISNYKQFRIINPWMRLNDRNERLMRLNRNTLFHHIKMNLMIRKNESKKQSFDLTLHWKYYSARRILSLEWTQTEISMVRWARLGMLTKKKKLAEILG